jgi:hypothetical protein
MNSAPKEQNVCGRDKGPTFREVRSWGSAFAGKLRPNEPTRLLGSAKVELCLFTFEDRLLTAFLATDSSEMRRRIFRTHAGIPKGAGTNPSHCRLGRHPPKAIHRC